MCVNKLWSEYKNTESIECRNELIMQYLPIVRKVVNVMLQGTGNMHVREDFYSIGILGLIDAIQKYDYLKKVKFETYASIRIRGAIKDHMRKQDWVSRGIREKQRKIEQAEMALREKLVRQPSDEEISKETGMSINELHETMEKIACADIVSFEHAVSNGIMPSNKGFGQEYNPEDIILKKEIEKMLVQALETLNEREQKIISLYYREELTLKEIGYVMNISESRVSQIMKNAMSKLNKKITKQ